MKIPGSFKSYQVQNPTNHSIVAELMCLNRSTVVKLQERWDNIEEDNREILKVNEDRQKKAMKTIEKALKDEELDYRDIKQVIRNYVENQWPTSQIPIKPTVRFNGTRITLLEFYDKIIEMGFDKTKDVKRHGNKFLPDYMGDNDYIHSIWGRFWFSF